MRKWNGPASAFDGKTNAAATRLPECGKANRVMIVATSPVNRIVVSRIVERAGLKALCVGPDEAAGALSHQRPALVIIDDAENVLQPLVIAILAQRETADRPVSAILLAKHTDAAMHVDMHECFNAIVTKPFTPEMLQPVLEKLLALDQPAH